MGGRKVVILLVLSFFLVLSGYVVSTLQSSGSAEKFVREVYEKEKAYHALSSLIPYVLQELRREDSSVDTLLDPWAFPFEVETEKGKLEVIIYDEDRFVSLNHLKDKIQREIMKRLLKLLEISPGYMDRMLAWTGAETSSFETGYPIKRAPFDSPEELRYLGMTREDLYGKTVGDVAYPGLLSLVSAYSSGKINVNTAPKYVLMALDPRIDGTIADRIIEYRSSKPFKRVQDLVLVEGVTLDILYRIQNYVDVKSRNFRIKATVKTGDVETTLELVYDREANKILYKRIY